MSTSRRLACGGLLLLAAALLLAWSQRATLLGALGAALVRQDAAAPADVAVLSTAAPRAAAFEAARLYHTGQVRGLAVFAGDVPPLDRAVRALGIAQLPPDELAAAIAQRLGVPSIAIERLPAPVDGTNAEAAALLALARQRPGQRLLLITTPLHSARAHWLLRQANPPIAVLAAPFDDFDPAAWWQSREGTREVILEYLRWANTLLGDGWARVGRDA